MKGQSDVHLGGVFGAGTTIKGLGNLATQGGTMAKRRALMQDGKLKEWFAGTSGLYVYWIQYRLFTDDNFTRSQARDNAVAKAR